MSNYVQSMGVDEPVTTPATTPSGDLLRVEFKADEILRRLDAQDRSRRIALWFAIGSALFAAVRLGVVTIPKLRSGGIGSLIKNPRRRRR